MRKVQTYDEDGLRRLIKDMQAEAWDAGWEACANYVQDADCDPAFWNLWHQNPYRTATLDEWLRS